MRSGLVRGSIHVPPPPVPNSTLPAIPSNLTSMVKDPEHSTDWIFFVGGTLFTVFFLLLVYVLYKHCCKKEQQQALSFSTFVRLERGEPKKKLRSLRTTSRGTPKIQNSQINLNVSAEEINTPQIVSPSGSLDRTSTSSDSVEKDLSDNSSGSRVGVLPRQKEDRVPLAVLAGIVPKGEISVQEDSEPDTDSVGSKIDPAGNKIDPSKTDDSSAVGILSADKLSIAIEQAKKKKIKV